MDTKKVLIIGVVGAIGIGVYLYFKPKENGLITASGVPDNANSQISVPPTGTVLQTPAQVAETAQKIADAKALAIEIKNLKIRKESLILASKKDVGGMFGFNKANIYKSQISTTDLKIKDLEKLIADLGYTEVNGSVVKIV
jgi:hypothetical protein